MKRSVILFSVLVFLISFGISGANDLVHLQQEFLGEDNPRNQKWLTTDDKDAIAHNIVCMPNKNPPDPTIPKFRICTVKYLTSYDDRKPYELRYERADNKFYLRYEKTPYDSKRATEKAEADKKYALYKDVVDTENAQGSLPAIWAMGPAGRLYVSSIQQPGLFNHSSFLAGGSVICAGEIIIIDGKIKYISNRSGHYRPPDKTLDIAIDKLREQGVKLDPALVLKYEGAKHQQSLKDHDSGVPSGRYSSPPSLKR
jgi:hypothetical protein